jgi:hypothetical protein
LKVPLTEEQARTRVVEECPACKEHHVLEPKDIRRIDELH